MGKLIRFLWRLVTVVLLIALHWVIRVLRFTLRMMWLITPYILQVFWHAILIMCASAASSIVGLPTATERMANAWCKQAMDRGFPTLYDSVLFHILRVVAFFALLIGWVLLVSTSVGVFMIVRYVLDEVARQGW